MKHENNVKLIFSVMEKIVLFVNILRSRLVFMKLKYIVSVQLFRPSNNTSEFTKEEKTQTLTVPYSY